MGQVRLRALARTADELAAFLADVEAATLVRALRACEDADLAALLADRARGEALVDGVQARLGDLAIPAQLAQVHGTVRWEGTDLRLARQVRIDGTTVEPGAGGASDLTVRAPFADLLRLVAGQLDVSLGYLGGDLDLEGDADLALALASSFAADGTDPIHGRPVDPRAIDPVEVSRALLGVSTEHLRSVLASGFRPVILEEIFERMPAYVNSRKAAGLRVTVGFRLTGRPDGKVDRYVLRLQDGRVTVLAGEAADAVGADQRDATVTCEAHQFLRLATGHLSAVTGVLRGQLKVRGEKAAALRLNAAFDIPSAVAG